MTTIPSSAREQKCRLPYSHFWLSRECLEVPFSRHSPLPLSLPCSELLLLRTLQFTLSYLICGPHTISIRDTGLINLSLKLISKHNEGVKPNLTECLGKNRNTTQKLTGIAPPRNCSWKPEPKPDHGEFLLSNRLPGVKASPTSIQDFQSSLLNRRQFFSC